MEMRLGNTEDLKKETPKETPKHVLSMLKMAQNPKEPIVQIRMVATDGTLVILKRDYAENIFGKPYVKVEKQFDVKVKFFHTKEGKEVKMNVICELYDNDVYIPIGNVIDVTQIEAGVSREGMIEILENFQEQLNNPTPEPSNIALPNKKIILPGR